MKTTWSIAILFVINQLRIGKKKKNKAKQEQGNCNRRKIHKPDNQCGSSSCNTSWYSNWTRHKLLKFRIFNLIIIIHLPDRKGHIIKYAINNRRINEIQKNCSWHVRKPTCSTEATKIRPNTWEDPNDFSSYQPLQTRERTHWLLLISSHQLKLL